MTDRGVSDVVGFVLTFSTVLLAVGVVTAGGFGALTDLSERQEVQNSERGMSALGVTMDSMHRSGDTYREPSLTLSDSELSLNTTQINITSNDSSFNSRLDSLPSDGNITVNALEHRFDRSGEDIVVLYEAGAVFRTRSTEPRYGPSILCREIPDGDTQAIVSLVNLSAGERISQSVPGTETVDIQPTSLPDNSLTSTDNYQIDFQAERVDQSRVVDPEFDASEQLVVDVSGASRPALWGTYFTDSENEWSTTGSAATFKCDADSVLVRVTTIELSVAGPVTT